MHEYELYIPLDSKRPAQRRQLAKLKQRLAKHFGGMTYFPHSNEGVWRFGGVSFHDEIVILRVLSANAARAEAYLRTLKHNLQREWKQKEILIIARPVQQL